MLYGKSTELCSTALFETSSVDGAGDGQVLQGGADRLEDQEIGRRPFYRPVPGQNIGHAYQLIFLEVPSLQRGVDVPRFGSDLLRRVTNAPLRAGKDLLVELAQVQPRRCYGQDERAGLEPVGLGDRGLSFRGQNDHRRLRRACGI